MTVVLPALVIGALLAGVPLWLALRRLRPAVAAAEADARAARASATEAERRRVEALQDLPLAALRLGGTGRVVEVNRAALSRFPFLQPGMGMLEAFSEHRLAREVDAAIQALEPRRTEVRLFVEGRRTYVISIVPYALGGEREALLFVEDASEIVDYQELRSQFVANVSHELRTPLTGLRGLLEALADPGMDERTRADFTARAAKEAGRLEALIADVLFLSELESSPRVPSSDRSDLAEAARAAERALADLAAEQRVRLRVEADGPVWTPLSERMAQTVVRNLLENAVKYAGNGATATATVRADGARAVLTVADDGAGIAERHLPHVFERFYRADPSRSKRLGGTGLGLSLVKNIAERYGGEVAAASREGYGTTMTVVLPLAEAPGAAPTPVGQGAARIP